VLPNPPRVPLEEVADRDPVRALAPEAKQMFEWAHVLHRQSYDVLADERLSQAEKDREMAKLLAYYKSRPDVKFSSVPKSMKLMQEQAYSLAFRKQYPKFNGLIWGYHWLQVGLYEPLLVGRTFDERQALSTAAVARFRQMLQDPPRTMPYQMPMTAAVAPEFARRYPEFAIVFDNLHSMHDVISDVLANDSVPRSRKRPEIMRAVRLFKDDTSYVMGSPAVSAGAAWRAMSAHMGVENMGGPAVGFTPALPAPTVTYGAVMTHDDRTGQMVGFKYGQATGGEHGGHAAPAGAGAATGAAAGTQGAGADAHAGPRRRERRRFRGADRWGRGTPVRRRPGRPVRTNDGRSRHPAARAGRHRDAPSDDGSGAAHAGRRPGAAATDAPRRRRRQRGRLGSEAGTKARDGLRHADAGRAFIRCGPGHAGGCPGDTRTRSGAPGPARPDGRHGPRPARAGASVTGLSAPHRCPAGLFAAGRLVPDARYGRTSPPARWSPRWKVRNACTARSASGSRVVRRTSPPRGSSRYAYAISARRSAITAVPGTARAWTKAGVRKSPAANAAAICLRWRRTLRDPGRVGGPVALQLNPAAVCERVEPVG
jgi:hypothetical protein